MSKVADAVRELETRQRMLQAELTKVDQQLRAIVAALAAEGGTRSNSPPRKPASVKSASPRHRFEPGEAVNLMRKLVTKPTRPAEVVRRLASAKGYEGTLGESDEERFRWATLSAIKAAVGAKRLVKHKDGKVAAA